MSDEDDPLLVKFNETRRLLIKLLQRPGDGPVVITGPINDEDHEMLVVGCMLDLLVLTIANAASFDPADARVGISKLTGDMQRASDKVCAEFHKRREPS